MSTISLEYPISLPLRRDFNLRWIVALVAGLVLAASVISVVAASSVKADSSFSVVAIPVPIVQTVDAQPQPVVMSTPSPHLVVIAVPVPEPSAP